MRTVHVVGLDGWMRAGSTSRAALQIVLEGSAKAGATVRLFDDDRPPGGYGARCPHAEAGRTRGVMGGGPARPLVPLLPGECQASSTTKVRSERYLASRGRGHMTTRQVRESLASAALAGQSPAAMRRAITRHQETAQRNSSDAR